MHLHKTTVPCPRCAEPIPLPVTVVAVPGAADDTDLRRRSRFLATMPPVMHRCPDLDQGRPW